MTRDQILKFAQQVDLVDLRPNRSKSMRDIGLEVQDQCVSFAYLIIDHLATSEKPLKVSPVEYMKITEGKENLVGRPVIWTEWPTNGFKNEQN